MLNWCEAAGLIERSPFPKRILPKVQERAPDRLTDEELQAVCSVPDPHGFICRFALGTGLRWGELVRVTAAHWNGALLVVGQTKSGKLRRVPLSPDLREELRLRVGRLNPFSSSGAFNRQVAKLPGVAGFHVHRLRHSFACLWLERGGSLAALQELLGHSTIVTTQRYGRLSEDHVLAEATRLGNLVTQVVTPQNRRNG
jgi:integrase